MDEPTIRTETRDFLRQNFPLAGDLSNVPDDGSLIDLGVVDSTGVLEVVGFIESRYGFEIPIDEIAPENLDSIDAITGYVMAKLVSSDAPA